MDNDCPIAMMLPSTKGMGVCSVSLLYFLVNTHDEFLGTYRSATNQDRYRLFSDIIGALLNISVLKWDGMWTERIKMGSVTE